MPLRSGSFFLRPWRSSPPNARHRSSFSHRRRSTQRTRPHFFPGGSISNTSATSIACLVSTLTFLSASLAWRNPTWTTPPAPRRTTSPAARSTQSPVALSSPRLTAPGQAAAMAVRGSRGSVRRASSLEAAFGDEHAVALLASELPSGGGAVVEDNRRALLLGFAGF